MGRGRAEAAGRGVTLHTFASAAVADGVFPGAVWAVRRDGRTEFGAAGRETYCPDDPAMTVDTLFDLASVSKVVGTTTVAMRMEAAGTLDLDRPIARDLPEFGREGNAAITPRNLLRHDAGLIAFRPYHTLVKEKEEVWPAVCAEPLTYETGTKTVYSDLNMIALARLLEGLGGALLSDLVREALPGLDATMYRPLGWKGRIAPTEGVEPWRRRMRERRGETAVYGDDPFIRGEVHDPTATTLGGVAGHAGLFSTVTDLARFCDGLFKGAYGANWRGWVRRQGEASSRALGWDTASATGSSAGSRLGPAAFGHTGYTGTSVWMDPDDGRFAVLLTNRVHPTAANVKLLPWRARFHDLAFGS